MTAPVEDLEDDCARRNLEDDCARRRSRRWLRP